MKNLLLNFIAGVGLLALITTGFLGLVWGVAYIRSLSPDTFDRVGVVVKWAFLTLWFLVASFSLGAWVRKQR